MAPAPLPQSLPHGLRSALLSDAWFADCVLPLQDCLLQHGRLQRLGAGESLFSRGQVAAGLCCVVSGALRIGATTADGDAVLFAYLEPYHWFGEISVIDGLPRTHDAVADGETQVLRVPEAELRATLDAHPHAWRDLGRLACSKLRVAFGVMEEAAQLPLEQRLLRRLQLLAQGYHSRSTPRRRLRLSQATLAEMLGVTRQSTNRALKALEQQGRLRLRYGLIELIDGA